MKAELYFFSGTGNSYYIAKKINALLNSFKLLGERSIKVSNTFSAALPDNSIIFPTPDDKIQPMFDAAESKIQAAIHDIKSLKISSAPKKKLGSNLLSSMMLGVSKTFLGLKDMKINNIKCALPAYIIVQMNLSGLEE